VPLASCIGISYITKTKPPQSSVSPISISISISRRFNPLPCFALKVRVTSPFVTQSFGVLDLVVGSLGSGPAVQLADNETFHSFTCTGNEAERVWVP
jgi:hypothetical protein